LLLIEKPRENTNFLESQPPLVNVEEMMKPNCTYIQALIDRSAVAHNCRILRPTRNHKMCVAVKANAYGHGVDIVLPVLQQCGIDMLGVACIEEASELRDLGWKNPILLLGSEFSVYPAAQQEQLAEFLVENQIRITATRRQDLNTLSRTAVKLNQPAFIHLAMDSGMSRMGLNFDDLCTLIHDIQSMPMIRIEGVYTHLATADSNDKTYANHQLTQFNRLLSYLKQTHIEIPIIHAANSGATVDLPQAHFTMVRPGVSVYGYHAGNEMHNKPDLKPILKLVTSLTLVKTIPAESYVGYGCTFQTHRDTLIGLVPIGYADGYFRELSNRGKMIVHDQIVPVIGRVSMDQTILDLTDLTARGITPKPGDPVIVYDNRRESPNSVESVANLVGTIPYVVTTSRGRRIKRIGVN